MKTSLECIPCLVRQALDVARLASPDPAVHETAVRDLLRRASRADFHRPPPFLAQQVHRRLRTLTGGVDPYRDLKQRFTHLALTLAEAWQERLHRLRDPLELAIRLAIAANVIDLGAKTGLTEADLPRAFEQAVNAPLSGDVETFRSAVAAAGRILFLADNAGEIVFDRLLIGQIGPGKVTVAVRGAPVINDATLEDAAEAGLTGFVEVLSNGSDAPGTILEDCSAAFRRRFDAADLVVAKGQGNYETLAGATRSIFFLFKVKCPVVAAHAGLPLGAHALLAHPAPPDTGHEHGAGERNGGGA
ncbi:MAG: DUF89 family protein [Acidobacteria bacterium]|nr:DUF89 family protein [Acidobacteriota bacterium]